MEVKKNLMDAIPFNLGFHAKYVANIWSIFFHSTRCSFFTVDSCETHQFKCDNGRQCIDLSLRCNGISQDSCYDDSDEKNCPGKLTSQKTISLSKTQFSQFVVELLLEICGKMSNITLQLCFTTLYLGYQFWFRPLKRVHMIRNETSTIF